MVQSAETCDILIVGSGAAGLAAAAATLPELDALIVEKCDLVGGTTALSGGTLWVPANPVSLSQGFRDSIDAGRQFLDATAAHGGGLDDPNDVTYAARRDAFLATAPEMVAYLLEQGFRFSHKKSSYPDYLPNLPGAMSEGGRTIDPAIFDARKLSEWFNHLEPIVAGARASMPVLIPRFQDLRVLSRPRASLADALTVRWMALQTWATRFIQNSPVSMGLSLVAQLLDICRRRANVRILCSTELVRLLTDPEKGDAVTGAVVRRLPSGVEMEIHARKGVLLASAGFSRSQKLRDENLGMPTRPEWSLAQPGGDAGVALQLGRELGAATAHLDKVWGIPTMKDPGSGAVTNALFEIAKPHSIVVNQRGSRFFCEAQSYGSAVDAMYKQGAGGRFWLVIDQRYRDKYTLGSLAPGQDTSAAMRSGLLLRADTVAALAEQMGVGDHSALENAVQRWNLMCDADKREDLDFGRGSDAYQKYIGDPRSSKPNNPNMGVIAKAPFYAVEILPGDAGTRGGLLTDQHARVLRVDGSPVQGLYAAGNSTASIVTGSSPGAGVTLAPAMTFGYIAARHMAATAASEKQ